MSQSTRLKGAGELQSVLTSDIEMQFGVCPADFWSWFGSVFPCYAPYPAFWNRNAHPVPIYVDLL